MFNSNNYKHKKDVIDIILMFLLTFRFHTLLCSLNSWFWKARWQLGSSLKLSELSWLLKSSNNPNFWAEGFVICWSIVPNFQQLIYCQFDHLTSYITSKRHKGYVVCWFGLTYRSKNELRNSKTLLLS